MVIAYRSVPVESTDGQFEEKQQYDMAQALRASILP
jgi:hypothetical protein